MVTYAISFVPFCSSTCPPMQNEPTKPSSFHFLGNCSLFPRAANFISCKSQIQPLLVSTSIENKAQEELKEEKPKFRWVEVGPNIAEAQKMAISILPPKMTRRCKALMRQLVCYSDEKGSLSDLLDAWVKIMKPRRAHWLSVLKELNKMEHPLYIEVFFFSHLILPEQSQNVYLIKFSLLLNSNLCLLEFIFPLHYFTQLINS